MCSIGTLFAFILVSVGVMMMRISNPEVDRPFRVPYVYIVAPLGIGVCLFMIFGLGWENWSRLLAWLAVGFLIYFGYSKFHSKLNNPKK
jgi:APA family basic amino acid/polyamine antiporter